MKLSEAIRAGARLHPQGFNQYCTREPDGTITTCVLGAAYEGLTGRLPPALALAVAGAQPTDPVLVTLQRRLGWATLPRLGHPHDPHKGRMDLLELGVDLNDNAHLTREQIADLFAAAGY